MRTSKPILLVEDDNIDAMTVNRAMKELNITNKLVRKNNGEEAIEYLRDENSQKPCVILLDLNMPKMDGFEFLKIAKADEKLRQIPTIVLTTSKQEQDKVATFQCCVAGYIVKPTDYQKFVEAMKMLDLYWTLSELPSEAD